MKAVFFYYKFILQIQMKIFNNMKSINENNKAVLIKHKPE